MIDIASIIVSAIVMAIIGFITTQLWGVDVPKVVSDMAAILILTLPIMWYNPQNSVEETIQFLQNYIMTFVNIIIPALIGDAIGSAVSEIIKEFFG